MTMKLPWGVHIKRRFSLLLVQIFPEPEEGKYEFSISYPAPVEIVSFCLYHTFKIGISDNSFYGLKFKI